MGKLKQKIMEAEERGVEIDVINFHSDMMSKVFNHVVSGE